MNELTNVYEYLVEEQHSIDGSRKLEANDFDF